MTGKLFAGQAILLLLIALLFHFSQNFSNNNLIFAPFLHFLGGMWVAVASMEFFRRMNYSYSVWLLVLAVFVVGAGWEVFELYIFQFESFTYWAVDTLSDLVLDVSGGLVAFRLARTVYFSSHV